MGIHTWTGYYGYKKQCIIGIKTLLENFCFGCHTPDDVGGCHRCGIGRANLMMIDYLKESDIADDVNIKKITKTVDKEEKEFCWLRFHGSFEPKKASQKYLDKYKKDEKTFGGLPQHWATQEQASDRIKLMFKKLLDKAGDKN